MAFAYQRPAVPAPGRHALSGLDVVPVPGSGAFGLSSRLVTLLALILVDVSLAQVAFYAGAEVYGLLAGDGFPALGINPQLTSMALVLPIGYCLLNVYRVHGQAPVERFPLRVKVTCLLFMLLLGWQYATQRMLWPLGAAAVTCLLALALSLTGESLVRGILIRWKLWGVPAVVIGAGPTGQRVARVLQQMPELGLRPIGFFDDHRANGVPSLVMIENVPVLGSIADSAGYSGQIETAIVTTPADAHETVDTLAMKLGYRNIIVVPELHDLPTLWVRPRDLNGLIGLQVRCNLLLRRNRLLKQTLDQLITLPLVVLSIPVLAVLALWVMAVSKGSPFYAQCRAGKAGRPIEVWKLRTMYPNAEALLERHLAEHPGAREEWNRYFKLTDDPRILPGVGHFLRRTSLDELPQIFNVIRGDMSLVGPRPFPHYHLDQFNGAFQSLRSSVTPGITGLWQVSARSDGDLEVQQALDTYYIRNWSLWLDLYILSRTMGAVLAGRGAR
jgi:Undecaprenyl-phosphate galactose phosphotransferase WbaP